MQRRPQPSRHALIQNLADQAVPEPENRTGLGNYPGPQRGIDNIN
jgi:hypothetical protein